MNASAPVAYGIGGMGLFVAVALVAGIYYAARPYTLRAALIAAAWLLLTARLARQGLLARFDLTPPPLVFLMLAIGGGSAALGLSKVGTLLARNVPLWMLIGVQGFRLPLELFMHRAAEEGVMPVQMSYSGWNFDIVTGATALIVSALAATGRASLTLAKAWNAFGIATLTTIVTVALASTPMFRAFGTEPARVNTFVTHFPFVWLPAACVFFAAAGHIVIARALAFRRGEM